MARGPGRAVVAGASIAGLLSARVLTETFDEVVLLDRDRLPDGPADRRGAPQGRHVHGLLARGQQVLEELLPGLTGDLVRRGAPAGDMLSDAVVRFGGHRYRNGTSGLPMLCVSRPMLEAELRRRVRELPGVTVLDGCDVVGLATDRDRRRVTGVHLVRRTPGSADEVLPAGLVVDATGRGSRVPALLADLGLTPPSEDRVGVNVRYTSRFYRRRRSGAAGPLALIDAPTPDRPRGYGLSAVEDDRWLLTVFGVAGDRPPKDPRGFEAFAARLLTDEARSALAGGGPLGDPVEFHFPASVRRRYERVPDLLRGLLVTGDALCSFNPVYGQGIGVAALEALALRRSLVGVDAEPGTLAVQRDLARVVETPWRMGLGADLSMPGVDQALPVPLRALGGWVQLVHAAAAQDPVVGRAFLQVAGLVRPPGALFGPPTVGRVLGAAVRRGSLRGRAQARVPVGR